MTTSIELLKLTCLPLKVYKSPFHNNEKDEIIFTIPSDKHQISETIFLEKTLKSKNIQIKDIKVSPFLQKLNLTLDKLSILANERIKKPLENIIAVKDDFVGMGIFTTAPIPKGTVIGIYPGIIIPEIYRDKEYSGAYCARFYHTKLIDSKGKELELNIDARINRGICALIQHAPLAERILSHHEEIECMNLIDMGLKELSNISTANVVFQTVPYLTKYGKYPLLAYITIRDIASKEQILISYSHNYWKKHKPLPFDRRTGCVINKYSSITTDEYKEACFEKIFQEAISLFKYQKNNLDKSLSIFLLAKSKLEANEHIKLSQCDAHIILILLELAKQLMPIEGWKYKLLEANLSNRFVLHKILLEAARQTFIQKRNRENVLTNYNQPIQFEQLMYECSEEIKFMSLTV